MGRWDQDLRVDDEYEPAATAKALSWLDREHRIDAEVECEGIGDERFDFQGHGMLQRAPQEEPAPVRGGAGSSVRKVRVRTLAVLPGRVP